MFKNILQYVKDEKVRVIVSKRKVDVMNYKDILVFDDNCILIDCKEFVLKIKGNDLVINKLMDNEVLINGNIVLLEMN